MPFDRDDALKKADKFLRLGRLDQAITEYQRIVDEIPNDWKTLNVLGDLYLRADQPERATSLFARIADHLAAEGFDARAQAFYKRILKVTPDDERALEALAGVALRQGIPVEAKGHLMALARVRQASGDARGAAEALLRAKAAEPADLSTRREAARSAAASGDADFAAGELLAIDAKLFEPLKGAASDGDTVWPALELLADHLAERGDAHEAVGQIRRFSDAHPEHIAALMKLVELLVDVGGEDELVDAQARLAEAYLRVGSGAEARILAEDLVSRAPADPAHRDCLRRALALVGEPDPENAVAKFARHAARFSASLDPEFPEEPSLQPATGDPAARALFELSAAAIDLSGILDGGGASALTERAARDSEAPEIDLTEVLRELKPRPSHVVAAKKGLRMSDQPERSNLDDVFRDFRDEVSKQTAADAAEQHYKVALTYRDMGMLDDAVRELELAAREPRLRFEAASSLARLVRDRGDVPSAIDWFERAAEAPAPTPEAGRALLYELGQALESCGEVARALAVYLELRADAGDYADLKSRIERLSRVQTES